MTNSALLMSQNWVQTNLSNVQNNQTNTQSQNWFRNTSTNTADIKNSNKSQNEPYQIPTQRQLNVNRNESNINDNIIQNRGRGNQNPTQSVVRNTNPIQVQRQNINSQRGNVVVINEINTNENTNVSVTNDDSNPIFANGNLEINTENVQNKQIQFLADNNDRNIQLSNPQINLEFNIEQQVQTKTAKVKTATISRPKEVKIKTFTPLELKPANTRIRNASSESNLSEIKIPKVKTEKTEKHKGGSSYSQNNKSYFGKKVKIWCQKNLKFVKKIRMSVSCPKF